MLVGLGVFVLGLVAFALIGFLLGLAFNMKFEVGYSAAIIIVGLIGIYFMGLGVAQQIGLL